MCSRGAWLFAGATLALLSVSPATALYDNSVNDTGYVAALSGNVWADDLHLPSAGLVSSVEFGYVAAGSTLITIRFYDNDAANSLYPGNGATLLFQRDIHVDPGSSGIGTIFMDPPLALPQHVWYAIGFNHFNGAVPLFDPPIVGSSADVLLRGNGTIWNGSAPQNYFGPGRNNFQIRLASDIPTPGSASLIGGSALLALGSRRRRR